jgi:hypothetical protein
MDELHVLEMDLRLRFMQAPIIRFTILGTTSIKFVVCDKLDAKSEGGSQIFTVCHSFIVFTVW